VIFLDDDIELQPEWLRSYHDAWKKYPKARLIGGQVGVVRRDKKPLTPSQQQIITSPAAWCLGATIGPDHDELLYPGGALVSANMSYRKSSRTVPLFDERIGTSFTKDIQFGSEDYELCQRLLNTGDQLVFLVDPRMKVWNRVAVDRFDESYLNLRYWLHGMELRVVEHVIFNRFPKSFPVYRGQLWWDATHWPNILSLLQRFLTQKREWIRLLSYLWNGRYVVAALEKHR
jgi:GT2 family glycosyltransferase